MPRIVKEAPPASRPVWEELESFARTGVQTLLQQILEQEVEELLGRAKSERLDVGADRVYRNGHGKSLNGCIDFSMHW